jgi:hypothetical protein
VGQTCRQAVLAAFGRLERRHGCKQFALLEVIQEVESVTDEFAESTIRTHVTSVMCVQAPVNHGTTYDDLDRVGRGRYQRR